MLRSKSIFFNFRTNLIVSRSYFATKPLEKVTGYHEKPNENEIKADYIGNFIRVQNSHSYIKNKKKIF